MLFFNGLVALNFLLLFLDFSATEVVQDGDVNEYDNNVLILNEKNYEEIIQKSEYIFVDIYSPGCEWCGMLEPRYEKVATQLKEEGSVIKISKVNDLKNPKVGEKFNVHAYPTLILFYKTIPIIYDDKLTQVAIVRWLKKRYTFLPKEIKRVESVKELISSAQEVVLGYFDKNNTAGITKFYQLTTTFDDVPFGIIHDKIIAQTFNISDEGIVYFEKFTKDCVSFEETKTDIGGIMNYWNRKCRQ